MRYAVTVEVEADSVEQAWVAAAAAIPGALSKPDIRYAEECGITGLRIINESGEVQLLWLSSRA